MRHPVKTLIRFSPLTFLILWFVFSAEARFQTRGTWEGRIAMVIEDDLTMSSSRLLYLMKIGTESVEVNFGRSVPAGLKSGDLLRVDGVRIADRITAEHAAIIPSLAASSPCTTTGTQNIIAILVNF